LPSPTLASTNGRQRLILDKPYSRPPTMTTTTATTPTERSTENKSSGFSIDELMKR
jgi:hypothetical protein